MAPKSAVRLNCAALYLAMDAQRRDRKISWRAVTREMGMKNPASLIARLRHGSPPAVDNLVAMLEWLGTTDLQPFLVHKGET